MLERHLILHSPQVAKEGGYSPPCSRFVCSIARKGPDERAAGNVEQHNRSSCMSIAMWDQCEASEFPMLMLSSMSWEWHLV